MSENKKTAGAFDVRSIIGALLSVYGVILVVTSFVGSSAPASPDAPAGGGDVNANLWAGLALLVVGLAFLAWWRLKPIVVPDDVDKDVERPSVH